MEDRKFTVIDENGNEKEMEIIFTYQNEETQKNYVFYVDPTNEEEIFVSAYDEEGHLFPIETEEEWDHLEEVLDHYQEEDHCCHHDHPEGECGCHHGEDCECHHGEDCECHHEDKEDCCCKDKH